MREIVTSRLMIKFLLSFYVLAVLIFSGVSRASLLEGKSLEETGFSLTLDL